MENTQIFIIKEKGEKRLLYRKQGEILLLIARLAMRPGCKNKRNVKHPARYWVLKLVKNCPFSSEMVVKAYHAIKQRSENASRDEHAFAPGEYSLEPSDSPTNINYSTLTDEQKMKLISYVCGYETEIKGIDHGYGLYYRIVPNKKLLFFITSEKAYANDEGMDKLIAHLLTFICFFKGSIKEYSTEDPDGKMQKREREEHLTFYTTNISFPIELRTNMNLSPNSIVALHEDKSFYGTTASEGIQAFFEKLIAGKMFLSINTESEHITVSKWNNGVIEQITYTLHPEHRNHKDGWEHLQKSQLPGWTIEYISKEEVTVN